jgi:hypothetical protein
MGKEPTGKLAVTGRLPPQPATTTASATTNHPRSTLISARAYAHGVNEEPTPAACQGSFRNTGPGERGFPAFKAWGRTSVHRSGTGVVTAGDSDQLLALALARGRERPHLRPVRTHEEIFAAARRARARAVRTREGLRGSRERFAAILDQTTRVHARLQAEFARK